MYADGAGDYEMYSWAISNGCTYDGEDSSEDDDSEDLEQGVDVDDFDEEDD
jgi:hypothetical protein